MQTQLDELRTSLAQLQQTQRMKERRVAEGRGRIASFNKELTSLGTAAADLESIDEELAGVVSGGGVGLSSHDMSCDCSMHTSLSHGSHMMVT